MIRSSADVEHREGAFEQSTPAGVIVFTTFIRFYSIEKLCLLYQDQIRIRHSQNKYKTNKAIILIFKAVPYRKCETLTVEGGKVE